MDNEKNIPEMEDEELTNLVVLNDEEGNEVQFEFLDLIELDSEQYAILLPVEEDADEETLNKVFEIFKEKFKDEFNFLED